MEQRVTSQSSLPRERAFVVQLYAEAAADRLSGRVEHVQSGEAGHFESLEALYTFITHCLAVAEDENSSAATSSPA